MLKPDLPENEDLRIQALYDQKLLDSPPERAFDEITAIGSRLFEVKMCVVSLIDHERQWFKSACNLNATETSREISFCGHAILQDQIFEIPDATKDERFHDNPLVVGFPHIRFYCGIPIYSNTGYPLGTLCLIHDKPHKLSEKQRQEFKALAKEVEKLIQFRTSVLESSQTSLDEPIP